MDDVTAGFIYAKEFVELDVTGRGVDVKLLVSCVPTLLYSLYVFFLSIIKNIYILVNHRCHICRYRVVIT
jgi:hypothetical protein